jgi:metal-responsive CopG/Arc/MetJ family transcriptional regulator
MSQGETEISLRMPAGLIEKIDEIARMKYLNRADVIIDACAYYCQHHDMHNEWFPKTMRNVFFDLARHDEDFRQTLRELMREYPLENIEK